MLDSRYLFSFPTRRSSDLLIFLEADEGALLRRFSETRRPHPLGGDRSITKSIQAERARLAPIRDMADLIINTSKLDRKSTRLNSSHANISYAVFCLKKKKI